MSKQLPEKLAEDMASAMRYKPSPNPVDRIFDDSVERAMFDDILASNRRPGSAAPNRQENSDFNSAIIKRLRAAEQDLFNVQREHARLKHHTAQLQAENDELKRNAGRNKAGPDVERDVQLARENSALRTQVAEMEQFLADYGLAWNGYDHRKCTNSGIELPAVESRITPNEVKTMPSKTYTKFAEKIEELNAMIRSEPTQIVTDAGRARFVHAAEAVSSIKITYYRNGLMVKRGPFRYNDSDSFKSFVRDIMDGYFPSELQGENPDGVIIDLKDKSHIDYTENAAFEDRMTGFQLLKRLPKQIVKNGEIIEIAADISDKLGQGKNSNKASKVEHKKGFIEPIMKGTGAESPSRLKEPVHLYYEGGDATRTLMSPKLSAALPVSLKNSSSPLSTALFGLSDSLDNKAIKLSEIVLSVVQIKCGNGGPTFVLKMPQNSYISELRKMIRDYFAKDAFDISQVPDIELRSAFPPRVLTDDLTMQEAGLVPNGTIHAKLLG